MFPENDLLWSLISLYFDEVNIFLPILNEISFKGRVVQGLHLHDQNFATTVLLVRDSFTNKIHSK